MFAVYAVYFLLFLTFLNNEIQVHNDVFDSVTTSFYSGALEKTAGYILP